jgi:hypothetical protein
LALAVVVLPAHAPPLQATAVLYPGDMQSTWSATTSHVAGGYPLPTGATLSFEGSFYGTMVPTYGGESNGSMQEQLTNPEVRPSVVGDFSARAADGGVGMPVAEAAASKDASRD